MRIRAFLQQYSADESGAVVIIFALFLTVSMGFLAVGIDLGSLYFHQKTLQTQADMVAVSAVLNLHEEMQGSASAPYLDAGTKTVRGNALSAGALTTLSVGRYDYDPSTPTEDRFTHGSVSDEDLNAAKATLSDTAPLFFAQSFLNTDSTEMSASATAARFDFASFSLGSRLLSLNSGESILDGLLGSAFDTTVDLDLLDYQALLDTQIDLLTFSDALGNRIGAAAGNYETILTSNIELADIAGAILDTGLVSGSTDVLTTILNSTAVRGLNAADLIGMDGGAVALQLEDILAGVNVNVLDLLKGSLDIVNEGRIVEVNGLDLNLENVLNVDLDLVVGEREEQSGWIMLGERGATVHTAQVRLKLDLDLSPTLLSNLGTGVSVLALYVPLYVEIASATATLTNLNCKAAAQSDTVAIFDTGFTPFEGVTGTHVVEMFIGNFDPLIFKDMTTPLDPADLQPANFLDLSLSVLIFRLNLLTLQLQSHAGVGVSQQPVVEFFVSEIGGAPKTISSGELVNSTLQTLLDPNVLEVNVESESLSLVSSVFSSLLNVVLGILPDQLLGALLEPLDLVVDGLLNTLGIGIGQGDLTLDGVSCGKVILVH
ncbi:TadG family pilus assembly protein [Thalassospira alkalitolerans]|uniref:TadG family pilus assembly protein n=1 Tax=Thalassospira alkalitolerans TaxID=1293890 RepID=UPI003AA7D0F1